MPGPIIGRQLGALAVESNTLLLYQTFAGRRPFEEWLFGLEDFETHAKIKVMLDRLALGNPGDYKNIGLGVFELRIHWGAKLSDLLRIGRAPDRDFVERRGQE